MPVVAPTSSHAGMVSIDADPANTVPMTTQTRPAPGFRFSTYTPSSRRSACVNTAPAGPNAAAKNGTAAAAGLRLPHNGLVDGDASRARAPAPASAQPNETPITRAV